MISIENCRYLPSLPLAFRIVRVFDLTVDQQIDERQAYCGLKIQVVIGRIMSGGASVAFLGSQGHALAVRGPILLWQCSLYAH